MKKILALWALPRSTSTAFERMMQQRGDFLVLDEPFGLYFHYSEERKSDRDPEVAMNSAYNFQPLLQHLTWEKEIPPEIHQWEGSWHSEVQSSRGFEKYKKKTL
ncbi:MULTISPECIES: hypothetical protein [unclassified Roseofilum]|uniref:hypothetical protein n=1 Tax=unclassified Roseofilum TaxID=2620099 RepID=UPI00298E4F8E|nr:MULTISPECIES: hypothetical protein [unclassified Roseofilum]